MKKETKSCENCAHFYQHYGWSTNNQFMVVNCGHCLKRNLTCKDKRNFPFWNGCEEWQPKEIEIARREESLKSTLTRMAKQLDEIITLIESGYLEP